MDHPLIPDKRRRKCSWNWIQPSEVAGLLYYVFNQFLYLFGRLYSWFDHVKWRYWKARIDEAALWSKIQLEITRGRRHKNQFFLSWELEVFWEIVMAIVMFDPLGWFSPSLYELFSDWLMKTCFEYVFQWQFLQVSWPSDGMKLPKSSGFHLIWTKCQKPLHVTGLFLNQNWINSKHRFRRGNFYKKKFKWMMIVRDQWTGPWRSVRPIVLSDDPDSGQDHD